MTTFYSQITEIITTVVLVAILITIYHQSSKTYIANLLYTFISYGVLIILSFVRDQYFTSPILYFFSFLLLYLTSFLAIKSSFTFFEIKLPKISYLIAIILYFIILTFFIISGLELYAEGFGYIILGISLIFLGIQWAIRQILKNGQNRTVGVLFIILGTHFLTFIILQNNQQFFIIAFYFAAVLEMLLTFFIVKAYFIEALDNFHFQNDKYINFFENSSDSIILIDQTGIIECNNSTSKMLQLSKDKIIGKLPSTFSPLYQANGKKSKDCETIHINNALSGQSETFEWIHRGKDGSEIYCEVSIFQIANDVVGAVTRDITPTVINKDALTFHKNYDSLTKLPKRSLFIDRLDRALELNKDILALLAIDITNFKGINDQYGHDFGDQFLIKVAALLKQVLGDHITMMRLGGDEFILLLDNLPNQERIVTTITLIEKIFQKGINIDETVINTSVCFGVVFQDDLNSNSIDLIKNVDLALNQAKIKGRGQIEFYSKTGDERFNERVLIEKEMIEGVKNNEFIPHFQPIIDAKTDKIVGAEALMRWERKDSKQVFPDVFIPISEDTSLIIEMGETILRQSCLACLEIIEYIPQFTIHVNLSPVQIESSDIVNTIKKVLTETTLPARHLEVEITEGVLIKDEDQATDTIQKIRNLGVLVSLDDFGTGYSSLSYLDRLNIDTVKIDRVFIVNIPRNKRANLLLETITSLVHNLDYKIIAEGVEEEDQALFIKSLGCDRIQGYYYYRPMPFEQLETLIKDSH